MKDTIKGCVLGALVAAGVSVLLAQTPTWTTPRDWATNDLLTANDFNAQFRDNLLWLRQDAQLTGTAALDDLGCGTLGTNEVLFSDCTWATIPDQTPGANSIGVSELNLATGTMGWTSTINFDLDRYAYFPRLYTSTSRELDCTIDNILSNELTSTTSTRLRVGAANSAACTANWDYAAASDHPSVWAVIRDADGVIVALRESEDTTTDPPVSVPYDDNDNPLTGYTVINVGLPTLTVIESLYGGLTATVRTAALSCTGDYVTGRGWLSSFTSLPDLSNISARYEPSGRQWAMRCAAQASDEAVTAFYLGRVGRRCWGLGCCALR